MRKIAQNFYDAGTIAFYYVVLNYLYAGDNKTSYTQFKKKSYFQQNASVLFHVEIILGSIHIWRQMFLDIFDLPTS